MLTYRATLDSTGAVYDNIWKEFSVADYTTAIIKLNGNWTGPVSFWGDNEPTNSQLINVQDLTLDTNTTYTIGSGASTVKIYRANVTGFVRIGIFGDIYDFSGFGTFVSGTPVEVIITLTSDTNAR
jgi:hypothetical protein